jgi:2-polyprenyl-3-methyl-5-hydroxy-6-metoxy-1,4-benzoquinol methylase
MKPSEFYDSISKWYHDLYVDWEQSMKIQAAQLDSLIRRHAIKPCSSLLDASCGIGTQAIGLAALGYNVAGSDDTFRELDSCRV